MRAGAVPLIPGRQRLERRSRGPLVQLARLPRWLVLIVLVLLVVAALLLPGWAGAGLLVLLAALVGWLLTLAWPVLSLPGRCNRLLLIVVVLVYATVKAVH